MNCCDSYGQCKQGHGCPARCTPAHGECHCDAAIAADTDPMLPLDMFDHFCIWSVLACLTVAFCFGVAWVVGFIARSQAFTAAQDWIASAAQWLVSILPMTPFF